MRLVNIVKLNRNENFNVTYVVGENATTDLDWTVNATTTSELYGSTNSLMDCSRLMHFIVRILGCIYNH